MSEQMTSALVDLFNEIEIAREAWDRKTTRPHVDTVAAAREELRDMAIITAWFLSEHQGEGSGFRYVAASEARDRILARMKS